jgi:glycosyltransferase involved in cell wall biosynthesis
MKRALIITYYWPPSGGAGVQRWLKFTKYLREFGWEPLIYTPENPEFPERDLSLKKDIPEGITILKTPIREPYAAYKRITGRKKQEGITAAFVSERKRNPLLQNFSVWIRGNLFIPDARALWIRPSVRFLTSWLADNTVDVVVSTGPPHSMHLIAMKVAGNTGKPWLADFRDPWTNIDFYRDLRLTPCADRRHRKLERQVLNRASAVTVVGDTMAREFRTLCDRKYHVITNGFDPGDLEETGTLIPDARFSLAHIGTMGSTRNPESLWQALRDLLAEETGLASDLEIKLVGKVDYSVLESLDQAGLTRFLNKTEYLPHEEVVAVQRQSAVLLLIINNTPNARTILTGKFFEYLAARRPILCLGPSDGDAAAILQETQAGRIAGFDDTRQIREIIREYYRRFKSGTLSAGAGDIARYSRRNLTGHLARVLEDIKG